MRTIKTILFIVLLLGISSPALIAQNALDLSWTAGSESDLYLYRIFRSTSANASTQIDCVQHPKSNYTDNTFQKGVLYFYRLKAVDLSLNASGFSQELSLAVPKISGLQTLHILPADTTITISLDPLVTDPDDTNIIWEITGASRLSTAINGGVASITTPADWSNQEIISFKASDDEGFYDAVPVTIRATGGGVSAAPEFSTIPEQTLDEDKESAVKLSDYVTDTDTDVENLIFSVTAIDSINLTIQNDSLMIKPAANWYGSVTCAVTVTDETGANDNTTFTITVNPVNDAPVLASLPEQVVEKGTTKTIGLLPYATDVDDTRESLSWSFRDEQKTSLSFNQTSGELSITALADSQGFDYITVEIEDDDGAKASQTLVVHIPGGSSAPVISTIPAITFDEDNSFTLELNNYVSDADDPVENLFWHNGTGQNVAINIDHTTNIATFLPTANWNGSEDVWLYVNDPNQNSDSTQVSVTVNPVNDKPELADLPSVNLSSQLTRTLNLKPYTEDIDNAIDEMVWTSSATQNVTVQISSEGIATFTASNSWLGQESVAIYVQDPAGASDTSTVVVLRQDQANAPVISPISDVEIDEDSQILIPLDAHASDPDNSISELTWKYSNNQNVALNINANREMSVIPAPNWFGSESIYMELSDPDNNVAFDTLEIIVAPVNDAPQLSSVGTISMVENSVYTLDLSTVIFDADGIEDVTEISVLNQGSSFIGVFLDMAYHQLTFFAPAGFWGTELFVLKVRDSHGEQSQTGFSVDISAEAVNGNIEVQYFGSHTNKNITYSTANETRDFIEFGESTAYGDSTLKEDAFSSQHTHILSNLQENTTYNFRVVSQSKNGTISYSGNYQFETSSGSQINVFPIPYKAQNDIQGNGISFTNLPYSSEVKIFNMLGEPVFKKEVQSSYFSWNVENNAGKKVSSGLYIYLIKGPKNKKLSSGKIIIIR